MTNITAVKEEKKPGLSIKTQASAALAAVAAAVVLPQLLHVLGAVSGLGTALGEIFLPMHLPVLLVGLLAGPYAGAAAGLLGPLTSFACSGMPGAAMLPFMMAELCIYGLTAGFLRNRNMKVFWKVAAAQLAGRAVRAAAILFAVFVLGNQSVPISVIWVSLAAGIAGIVLQWTLLPFLVHRVENRVKDER